MGDNMDVDHDNNPPEIDYHVMDTPTHARHRPDMYVGTTQHETISRDVIVQQEGGECRIAFITTECPPAFLKIVDEPIDNAQDYEKRGGGVTFIGVEVDKISGVIKVVNNGTSTIPTRPFQEGSAQTIAETVFGVPMSGSNFTNDDSRTHAGRNGMGVKLTNIFSKRFSIALTDPERGVEYHQSWTNGMTVCNPPVEKKSLKKKATTEITFLPDYDYFKIQLPLSDDIFMLLKSRVQDIAMSVSKKVKVTFNNTQMLSNDKNPIKEYAKCTQGTLLAHDKVEGENGARLEVAVVVDAPTPHVASFVNGIRSKGTAFDLVVKRISDALAIKFPEATRISSIVKDSLTLIVFATVISPEFNGQTKELLKTPASRLGFDYTVSPTFLKKLMDSSLKHAIEASIVKKTNKESSKAIRFKSQTITNYQKPTKLGGKKQCTLFICEGLSAAQMVVSGFRKIGREYNGLYPLKGKVLNCHDENLETVLKNKELLDLIHILGIDPRKEYDNDSIRKLPFGNVVILTDQDHDGYHITGLATVFFQRFFPSILRHHPAFLRRFVTPIVKAKDPVTKQYVSFFSLQMFKEWQDIHASKDCQYYKGLGTSSDKEAMEYFADMKKHSANFVFESTECHNKLTKWFSKASADDRKQMLQSIDHDACVDYEKDTISVTEFCDKELVHWSYANVLRTIPAIDGLKPGQRKVLYTLFNDGAKNKKYKVAELAANTIGFANFHHGEASLQESIAHMIQGYIGTNQIPYLNALSQAGSRDDPTKVHAAPRYANTSLAEIGRVLMNPSEDAVLDRNEDDGKMVEPKCYATTIPMVLINGCEGIGTGYSTKIPEYSIDDVVQRCEELARNNSIDAFEPMIPCPHFFNGTVLRENETTFVYQGIVEALNSTTLRITELPPQMWTNVVKEHMEEKWNWVKEVVIHSTGTSCNMEIHIGDGKSAEDHLPEVLKYISKKVQTNNMNVFDGNGILKKYEKPEDILIDHAQYKLSVCEKRLNFEIMNMERDIRLARAKRDYITKILDGDIVVFRTSKADLRQTIVSHGWEEFTSNLEKMAITSLTSEEVAVLNRHVETLESELAILKSKTPHDIWYDDIQKLKTTERYKLLINESEKKGIKRRHDSNQI